MQQILLGFLQVLFKWVKNLIKAAQDAMSEYLNHALKDSQNMSDNQKKSEIRKEKEKSITLQSTQQKNEIMHAEFK